MTTMESKDINTIYHSVMEPRYMIRFQPNTPLIFNPEHNVPVLLQTRLKLAVTMAHYFETVGRPIDTTLLTWDSIP